MLAVRKFHSIFFISLIFFLIAAISSLWYHNPPLYHTLSELLALIFTCGIFMVTWHTRIFTDQSFPLLMGITFFSMSLLNVAHLVTYNNLGNLYISSDSVSLKFYIAAIIIESIGLFGILFIKKKKLLPVIYTLILASTIVLFFLIISHSFPDISSGTRDISHTVISIFALILFTKCTIIYLLFKMKPILFNSHIFKLIICSIAISVVTDLFSLSYFSGPLFLVPFGHITFISSTFFMYKALFEFSLERPNFFLIKSLKIKQAELIHANEELERKIALNAKELTRKDLELQSEVAQKKSQKKAFRSSEERFGIILKNLKIIVTHCDRDLNFSWIHDPYEIFTISTNYGYNGLETLSTNEGSKQIMDLNKNVLVTGIGCRKEITFDLPDCEKIFDTTSEPIFDENGSISGVTTVAIDITDKKKFEEALNMRHSVLESIYSIATSSGCAHQNIYADIVSSIANLLDVPFVSISKIVSGEETSSIARFNNNSCECKDLPSVVCNQCSRIIISKKPVIYNSQSPAIHCDCLSCSSAFSFLGVPIIDSHSECIGTICIIDTKSHKFTSEQLQIIEIFSRYVANEFERDLIQKELIQSQEMKILGALTSGVAHEVRNPLNAIWAITEALFLDIKNDTHLNIYKDHIKSQVERLTLLMQELLDFGKPFSFKDTDQVSLPELCKKTIEMWKQSKNNRSHIEFVNKSINESGIIKGDPTKLQQVLVNLLDNASQHSPNESIITVHFCRKMSKYQIDIIDQGAGISKESLSRVFDPFFTTRPKGTGLGLSIVKHIINAHEGTIELYNNNPPPGATATVTLPMYLQPKTYSPSEHISKESITA